MLEPEYRIGLWVLTREIGVWSALKVAVPAALKSLGTKAGPDKNLDDAERHKRELKNRFRLLALLHKELEKQFGSGKTREIMHRVLMSGGQVFFRGFEPLGVDADLTDFSVVYKKFEANNVVFDVIEESRHRFEIVIRRCLIYEVFTELGIGDLTRWICDIAVEYFKGYHPRIEYVKDRMIARGDNTCHEVFTWRE
jgi:hypothetical protein